MKRKRKYWIQFYIAECPVCGRDMGYKIRRYGRKPKDPKRRYINEGTAWCGCNY